MSDNILEADDMFDESADVANEVVEDVDDQVGMTSEESELDDDAQVSKKSKLKGFTIYDSMLLVSLLCITLATLVMFFELSSFGNILRGEFPWRVSDFK